MLLVRMSEARQGRRRSDELRDMLCDKAAAVAATSLQRCCWVMWLLSSARSMQAGMVATLDVFH